MSHIKQRLFKAFTPCDNLNVLTPWNKGKGDWEVIAGVILSYLESRDQTHSRIIHVKFNWLCGFSKNSLYLCMDY